MLDLFNNDSNHLPKINETENSDEEVLVEISKIKQKLKDKVFVLGHHYQQDDVIQFADVRGDSLFLAKKASEIKTPYIIFCGVHFMAETADMLTSTNQSVILPDLNAGCSMADMATRHEVNKAWKVLTESTNKKIIPITYINCSADLKSFVGENRGSICTSSNAKKIISWALENGEKLLFFPDQHLGRNTCFELGIPLHEMVIYNPHLTNGGLTKKQIENAKIILWYGYCSVHQGFTKNHIDNIRKNCADTKIIVHPECTFDVVQASDLSGSTSYIINQIEQAPAGSKFAVGTEISLVNRLAKQHQDKKIISLSPYQCICSTMYRVRPRWLLESFRQIEAGNPINIIKVPENIKKFSNIALNQMLKIS